MRSDVSGVYMRWQGSDRLADTASKKLKVDGVENSIGFPNQTKSRLLQIRSESLTLIDCCDIAYWTYQAPLHPALAIARGLVFHSIKKSKVTMVFYHPRCKLPAL